MEVGGGGGNSNETRTIFLAVKIFLIWVDLVRVLEEIYYFWLELQCDLKLLTLIVEILIGKYGFNLTNAAYCQV